MLLIIITSSSNWTLLAGGGFHMKPKDIAARLARLFERVMFQGLSDVSRSSSSALVVVDRRRPDRLANSKAMLTDLLFKMTRGQQGW